MRRTVRRIFTFGVWAFGALVAVAVLVAVLLSFMTCGEWRKVSSSVMLKDKMWEHGMSNKIVEASQAVRTGRLESTIGDLQAFGERSTWEQQEAVCRYLVERLRAMGLNPTVEQYPHEDHAFGNIVVSFPGRVQPQKRILIVAHYDSKNWVAGQPSPGADDDGTGVSVLLELAQVIPTFDRQMTWQMVFFSNEERGQIGSHRFAEQARREGVEIAGVLSVDVVGYRPRGFSEIFGLGRASLDATRKLKGLAKIFQNGYLALKNGCAPLKLAFRSQELALAPPLPIREAFGRSVLWQLGSACP